jgi:hypothetical protein
MACLLIITIGKKEKMYLRYLQTPRLLISAIHVKLNMFEKMFHSGYTIQK